MGNVEIFVFPVNILCLREDWHVDLHQGALVSDEKFDQISLICDSEVRDFDPTVDVLVQPDECRLDLWKGRSIIWIDGIALAWYLKFIA